MCHNKRRFVYIFGDSLDAPDFQPRHDAVQNVLIRITQTATPLVYGHAAIQVADDSPPNFLALAGDDDDGGILLNAMNQKVNRLGCREVR